MLEKAKQRDEYHHHPQRPPDAPCGPGTGGQGEAYLQESHRGLYCPKATETANADPPTGSHTRLPGSCQSQRAAPHVLSGIGRRPAEGRTISPALGQRGHPKQNHLGQQTAYSRPGWLPGTHPAQNRKLDAVAIYSANGGRPADPGAQQASGLPYLFPSQITGEMYSPVFRGQPP